MKGYPYTCRKEVLENQPIVPELGAKLNEPLAPSSSTPIGAQGPLFLQAIISKHCPSKKVEFNKKLYQIVTIQSLTKVPLLHKHK